MLSTLPPLRKENISHIAILRLALIPLTLVQYSEGKVVSMASSTRIITIETADAISVLDEGTSGS